MSFTVTDSIKLSLSTFYLVFVYKRVLKTLSIFSVNRILRTKNSKEARRVDKKGDRFNMHTFLMRLVVN